eukprot:gene6653-biopygen13465
MWQMGKNSHTADWEGPEKQRSRTVDRRSHKKNTAVRLTVEDTKKTAVRLTGRAQEAAQPYGRQEKCR